MKPPVLTKADMYARLVAGEFGNTNPSWDGLDAWLEHKLKGLHNAIPLWGVRSKRAGDPRTKLNVPREDVGSYCIQHGLMDANISPMVPAYSVQWEGDVARDLAGAPGYLCCGNRNPEPGSWRTHMKKPREWRGSSALHLLRTVLNPNSFDDLMVLLDEYPDHVVELSALNVCFGTVPGRNAVVWEVRRY